MARILSLAALLAASAFAQTQPTVTIKNGTVIGSNFLGVDSFRGIPFAQPPVGNLRLKPPTPITTTFGTIYATAIPTSCPQQTLNINTTGIPIQALEALVDYEGQEPAGNATATGEDCLTLNVQRPYLANSKTRFPVVFWIYGGGFEGGSTQTYDGSAILAKAVDQKEPIIYVAANYRVDGFGFLAGKELAKEGSTNLGLRDQRLALQWVQENIAAFGGDPDRVTIWGESAGSISVYDHLIINGGDNTYNGKPLFRGAIMDSGTAIATDTVTAPQAQAVYDQVVNGTGCSNSSDTLACLRAAPYYTFYNAVNSLPGLFSYRSLDLAYLPRPDPGDNFFPQSPEVPLASNKFAKVPVIIGDQEDEGTLFSIVLNNITTNAEAVKYLATYFPTNPNATQLVADLLDLYPNEPDLGQPYGSPFRTGSANNFYPQFKRIAAVTGDLTFTLTRRNVLDVLTKKVKGWSYLDSYLYGTPFLGTFHGTDVLVDYGYLTSQTEPAFTAQSYYINFINHLNPNKGYKNSSIPFWPHYTTASPQLLNFQATQNVLIPDTFRMNASQFILKHASQFRV